MDLSRSNGQKKTFINANILIKISLIIPYLLYFISISKPKNIWLSLYVSLSTSFSSTIVSPPWIDCTYFVHDQISSLHSRKKIYSLMLILWLGSRLLFLIYNIPYLSLHLKIGIHFSLLSLSLPSLFHLHYHREIVQEKL